MRKLTLTLVILGLGLLLPMSVMAQNQASGTLQITATLQSSIYLTVENASGGLPALTSGAGTNAATLVIGPVSAFGGTLPGGVVPGLVGPPTAPTAFTLTFPFAVRVAAFNAGASTGYTLTAALQSADATKTWNLDTHNLSTTPVGVNGGNYGVMDHTFVLTIPTSDPAGPINNTIRLEATAS